MKSFKTKSISKKSGMAVNGGNTTMQHQQHTGTQTPGVSSQEKGSSGGFGAKGGTTKMFGKQTVKAQTPA